MGVWGVWGTDDAISLITKDICIIKIENRPLTVKKHTPNLEYKELTILVVICTSKIVNFLD